MNDDSILQSIDTMMDSWIKQKELHLEIKAYKNEFNAKNTDEKLNFDLDFHDDYIKFLEEVTQSVSTLRLKIIEKKH